MQGLTDFTLKLFRLLLGTALLLSVLLICANAFGRYVLKSPIIWAEEVLGFTLVWIVYLGAVDVTRQGGHLSMDLITQLLHPRWQRWAELLRNLVFLAVSALIVYQSFGSISQFNYNSQVAELPMNVLHAVIPVSFAAMFLLVVARCFQILFAADKGADQKPTTEAPVL